MYVSGGGTGGGRGALTLKVSRVGGMPPTLVGLKRLTSEQACAPRPCLHTQQSFHPPSPHFQMSICRNLSRADS